MQYNENSVKVVITVNCLRNNYKKENLCVFNTNSVSQYLQPMLVDL